MNDDSAFQVCLVSSGHPSSNPRLVKEADALTAEGLSVVVVHSRTWEPGDPADADLFARRSWPARSGWDGPGTPGYGTRRVLHGVARACHSVTQGRLLAWAQSPLHGPLLARATAVRAMLYLGHNLAALPVVAACAKQHGARYAFDVEDYHPGEREGSTPRDRDWRIADRLLATHLPGAAFVTAASPLIAAEIEARYGVQATTILNVFDPVDASRSATAAPWKPGERPRFYWFSQTVGPGRGLEFIIHVLGRLGTSVSLDLRGVCDPSYRTALLDLAKATGHGRLELNFLPSAPADDMVRLAHGYTAGISCEVVTCLNKDLCLGNKIFTYLAAGTPVVLTPTRAQRDFAAQAGEAWVLLDSLDEDSAAAQLRDWLARGPSTACLSRAVPRYSWREEQEYWFPMVAAALGPGALQPQRSGPL